MAEYERHKPEQTLLHEVVREQLESFLVHGDMEAEAMPHDALWGRHRVEIHGPQEVVRIPDSVRQITWVADVEQVVDGQLQAGAERRGRPGVVL